MRTAEIVGELPAAAREWLAESRWTRETLLALPGAGSLADALADGGRAARWANGAPALARDTLALIVGRFGSAPFAEERLASEGGSPAFGWTGAELRLAVQLLRRDGILFAMQRPWGDRMLVVPEDMYPVWRRLLLPLKLEPLPAHAWMDDCAPGAAPLSHQLIGSWAAIGRSGLPLKADGLPRMREAAAVASAMNLQAADCALGAAEPGWAGWPAQAALAVRLGLSLGMLRHGGAAIIAEPDETAREWLALEAACAERRLLEAAVRCLLPESDAGARLAAECLRDLLPLRWYRERDLLYALPTPDSAGAAADWIAFLRAAGWIETGADSAGPALRWSIDPLAAEPAGAEREQAGPNACYELLPDLEVIVPPEVSPGARWELERVARRLAEDVVAVYRLDRDRCRWAQKQGQGLTLGRAEALLERGSGAPVPAAVRVALRDWFGAAERADGDDRQGADSRAEEDGSRDGEAPEASRVAERLRFASSRRQTGATAPAENRPRPVAARRPVRPSLRADESLGARTAEASQLAWDARPPQLAHSLYPGADAVPPAWLQRPARYHASTLRQLAERAAGWRAALRLRRADRWIELVPERIAPHGECWRLEGRAFVRDEASGRPVYEDGLIALGAEEIGEAMILLPDAAFAESGPDMPIS